MTHKQLRKLLDELRRLPAETEWLEFKQASNSFDFNKSGKYFSALSNEANLKNKPCGSSYYLETGWPGTSIRTF